MADADRFTVRPSAKQMQDFVTLRDALGYSSSSSCGAMLIDVAVAAYHEGVLSAGAQPGSYTLKLSDSRQAERQNRTSARKPRTLTPKDSEPVERLLQRSTSQIDESVGKFASMFAVLMRTVGRMREDEVDQLMQAIFPDRLPEEVVSIQNTGYRLK